MIGSGSESNPFSVRHELGHVDTQGLPGFLNTDGHSSLPFVESLPSGLNGSNDALFEVSRVLLHDDDGFLQSVLFVDLPLQLPVDSQVDRERVFLAGDAHRGVGDRADGSSQISDSLGGEFSFLGDGCGELSSVVLNVLDVRLDFGSELLQVLNDGRINSSRQGCVGVGNHSSLVSNGVEDILRKHHCKPQVRTRISEHPSTYLHTTFTQELVACSEGDLNDSSELGQFLGSVGFNVGDTFKVC